MTTTQLTVLILYALIVAIWPIRYVVLRWLMSQSTTLSPRSTQPESGHLPRVSALIPARDEEGNLSDCLDTIRAQSYPDLEIIVVDDRSTDATPEIARRTAEADPRVRVVTMTHLPAGWTGKTHALQEASSVASGEWLWFLDADTFHHPDSLAVMLGYGLREGAALVSILPELRCETFWERVIQPLAGITLMQSFPLFLVNDDRRKLAFANGQTILVRRDAYDAAGGHRAVRDRFVEDIGMAYKVKGLGLPIRVALTRDLVSCRMYNSLSQLVRGWSRILYDALDRKSWRLLGRLLDPLTFCQTGHVALIVSMILLITQGPGPFPLWLLGLSVVHHVWMYVVLRLAYHASVPGSRHVVWYPLANLVVDVILIRSLWMCATGRVSWRGTTYAQAGRTSASPNSDANDPDETCPLISKTS
jgi:glycosyltransferase involved in cell wall biosynthesis